MDLGTARGLIEIGFDRKGVDAAKAAMADLGTASATLGRAVDDVGLRLAAFGAAATAPFAIAVTAAADFDAQLNAIAAVGGAAAQARLAEIEQAALDMGASTRFSASEAAAGMEELIKAGLPVQDVLDGAAQSALDLAAATGTSVPQAAEIMANALNVFGDSMTGFNTAGEKAVAISNLFAQAANASATDVGELGQAFSQAAIVAEQFGIPVEELTAQFGIFANAGLKGSDAGTSFKTMLLAMLDPTKEQAAAMEELGISFFDAQGEFIGLEGVAGELQGGLAGLTEEQRQTALAVLFGTDAVRAASIVYAQGTSGIDEFSGAMEAAGTVAEQAATRNSGLRGSLEELRGAAESLAISVGKELIPIIQPVVEGFTDLIRKLNDAPPALKALVGGIGGAAAVLTAIGGATLLFAGQVAESVTALKTFKTALDAAKASSVILNGALGPMGLAVAGVVAAIGLFAKAWVEANRAVDEATALAERADAVFGSLDATLSASGLQGYTIRFEELASAYPPGIRSAFDFGDAVNGYNAALIDSAEATVKAGGSLNEFGSFVTAADQLLKANRATLDDLTPAYQAYQAAIEFTGPAQDAIRESLARLTEEFVKGKIGPAEYVEQVNALLALGPDLNAQVSEQTKQQDALRASILGTNAAVRELTEVQKIQKDLSADLAEQLAEEAAATDDYAERWRNATRDISTGIVGNVDDFDAWIKAQEEAGVASRYATELTLEQAAALQELADELAAVGEEIIAEAKAQEEATVGAAREQAEALIREAERGGKERVKALERSGKEEVRAAQQTANDMIREAERQEAEIVAAAEATADARIKAAQRAEKEGVNAAEREATLVIREAERQEARTVAAAERAADAQLAAVEKNREQIVEAAQQQADGQIEAAQEAEKETVEAAERAADAQIDAAEKAAEAVVEAARDAAEAQIDAAEEWADRQVEAARRAEEATVKAAERAADAQIRAAERAAAAQERAIERRLQKEIDAAERQLQIIENRIDRQVAKEIEAAQRVYDARMTEIDQLADAEKTTATYELNEQYKERTRSVEDAAAAEIAAIKALGLSREEEAARILEIERRLQDEKDRINYELAQAEQARIAEIEAARTEAMRAAEEERDKIAEAAAERAEKRLQRAEERAAKIREEAEREAAKKSEAINNELERVRRDAARETARVAAEAAKTRETAEAAAAERVEAIREEAAARVEAAETAAAERVETVKQEALARTEAAAAAAAARREAVETAAAENVARVQEEQAAIAAAAEERISKELEDAKRIAARETADIRREQERIVRDEERALAKETADEIRTITDELENERREAAKTTSLVRRAADRLVRNAERDNQEAIRAELRKTEDEHKRINDWLALITEAAGRLRINTERRVHDETKRLLDEAKKNAGESGMSAGTAYGQGFADALRDMGDDMAAAARAAARKVKEATEKELEISSPSKWAMRIGGYVGDGLRSGLLGAMADAGAGARALAAAVQSQLTRGIEVEPIAAGYADMAAAGVAARQSAFRSDLAYANQQALAMPQQLEATVVIDGTDMGRFVVGTALAPIAEAARRTGTRREAWA